MNTVREDIERAYDEEKAKAERKEDQTKFLDHLYDTRNTERDNFLDHLFRLYKATEPLWKFLGWLRFWRRWR